MAFPRIYFWVRLPNDSATGRVYCRHFSSRPAFHILKKLPSERPQDRRFEKALPASFKHAHHPRRVFDKGRFVSMLEIERDGMRHQFGPSCETVVEHRITVRRLCYSF